MLGMPFEPALRRDDRHRRGRKHQGLAERAEQVGDDQPAELRATVRGFATKCDRGRKQQRNRGPACDCSPAAADEGRDHHQQDSADAQNGFGKDWSELDH